MLTSKISGRPTLSNDIGIPRPIQLDFLAESTPTLRTIRFFTPTCSDCVIPASRYVGRYFEMFVLEARGESQVPQAVRWDGSH